MGRPSHVADLGRARVDRSTRQTRGSSGGGRRWRGVGLLVGAAGGCAIWATALVGPLTGQARTPYAEGIAGLVHRLEALRTIASAMYVGAHPDDEDSALVARLARGDHARVAYLSLTRGEGGQNIIGPELFEALGIIRTEELLQARGLDGGSQLFSRAFDFGFSKTLSEARQRWDESLVIGDLVRAIRAFRPLIVIGRFSGTPADGHGHHQFAGYVTPRAYRAAGDPMQYPELALRPWAPLKLYEGQTFVDVGYDYPVAVDTGRRDPLLGRTYFEIAMHGRSQHKSQQMGMLELRGPQVSRLRLIESRLQVGPGAAPFEGIDTSLTGIAALAGLPPGSLRGELASAERAVTRAIDDLDVRRPAAVVPSLAAGLRAVRAARRLLPGIASDAADEADFLLAHKERQFVEALRHASGIVLDALVTRATVVPGEGVGLSVRAFAPVGTPARVVGVRATAPDGWRVEPTGDVDVVSTIGGFFRETPSREETFRVTVPRAARGFQPYWLRAPRRGDLYDWPPGAPVLQPFGLPLLVAELDLDIGGARVTVEQPGEFRYADRVRGELREPLALVPALALRLDPPLEMIRVAEVARPRAIALEVISAAQGPLAGTVRLHAPAAWRVRPAEAPFALAPRSRTLIRFEVTPDGETPPGAYRLWAEALTEETRFELGERVVAYPHIRPRRYYEVAQTQVRVVDLDVAPVLVGYIMGSGDAVPEAIRRMGLDVTLLEAEDLATGDLAQFDTIVVGIRASQTRPDFVAGHARLLDYVRGGGALIVQYQQPDYVTRGLLPFPAEMAARVTDERAPVRILEGGHPAFTFPNRITPADWDGWVQERSLYALTRFDERYLPLLESRDPGEPWQRGGQVHARLGRGDYVYTAYAWFRQLPAGVPGAYRLFANLLSLPRAPRDRPDGG